MKKYRIIVSIIVVTLLFGIIPFIVIKDKKEKNEDITVRFAVVSDLHYISEPSEENEVNVDKVGDINNRMMTKAELIVDQFISDIQTQEFDGMLISGDITSNGEKKNAKEMASKLEEISLGFSKGIYLINGNHDINNSYAAEFENEKIIPTERMSPEDFKDIFSHFGFGGNSRFFGNTASKVIDNSGSLSYATEIYDGITLIVLDTNIYGTDSTKFYRDAQITAGRVSKELLEWARQEAVLARKKGNLVLGMCHHEIMPHFSEINDMTSLYQGDYVLQNWKEVADTMADAGVVAFFTGHAHINDIASYISSNGNKIYDVSSATLGAFPCSWRTLEIKISKKDNETKYTLSIDTNWLTGKEGLELNVGDNKYDNIHDYSRAKTSIRFDNIEDIISYYIRRTLFEMDSYNDSNNGNGVQGYIKNYMKIKDGNIGDFVVNKIKKTVREKLPYELSFTSRVWGKIIGFTGDVSISLEEADISDNIIRIPATVVYSVDDEGTIRYITESGTIVIDITRLSSSVEEAINIIQKELDNADFTIYSDIDLEKEICKMASDIIGSIFELKTEDDVTLMEMINDGYQARAKGCETMDESLGIDYNTRLKRAEIFKSNVFKKAVVNKSIEKITYINERQKYPILNAISTLHVSEGGRAVDFIQDSRVVEPMFPSGSSHPFAGKSLIKNHIVPMFKFDTIGEAAKVFNNIQQMASIVPKSAGDYLGDKFYELYVGMISDTDEPNDWEKVIEYTVSK